jgi:HemN C-terminal domain
VGVEIETAPANVEDDRESPGRFLGSVRVQGRRTEHDREPNRAAPLHEPLTRQAYRQQPMDDASLEEAILLALRRSPGSRSKELAEAVGLPRTNFGRQLDNRLQQPLKRLLAAGLIDEDHGRYDLTREGRRRLAERASAIR